MGMQTSARLMYGIALPEEIEDTEVDDVINANPGLAELSHAWAGTWSGGTRYLVAYYACADLGRPETIPADELHPVQIVHWDARLRVAWEALGFVAEDMRTPVWILAANCT
ncbi:hypothetical protein ACGF0D_10570 [Kitasatospora sp. NPDC048298]|uniref:hypothetical protein n=1 Tax=Kitasatospora sp. NPDC048298 TaxID=3364049 RepID=UPI00371B518D